MTESPGPRGPGSIEAATAVSSGSCTLKSPGPRGPGSIEAKQPRLPPTATARVTGAARPRLH